jgi:hypothetical protein
MKAIKYSFYFFSATLLLLSCKKDLDLLPTDTFNETNAFQTMEDVQKGVNGAYAGFGTYASKMYASALISDEAKIGADNQGQGAITFRFQYGSDGTTGGDVVGALGGYYSVIDQVNRVLPYIPIVSAASPTEEARRNILKGQLLALRGISHFELMQMYSKNYAPALPGVPIMLASDVLARPSRNTMGEVITQVEKDLADAKLLLAGTAPFKDTVMNTVNIAAYLARISLWKGDFDAAITNATEVITAGVKPLVSGAAFSGIWTDANENEVLFRIRYAASGSVGGLWTTSTNLIYIAPSDKLVASYGTGDIRKAAYIGTNGSGNPYVNKFFTSSKGARVVDIKVIRISEMYLIRAEANARKATPNVAAAAADLNLVRANRITGYVDQTFGSATAVDDAIIQERFKEFPFEGVRLYDLKRRGLAVQRNASDAGPAWQTLPAGDYRFVLPIARDEVIANPNFAQNDGY